MTTRLELRTAVRLRLEDTSLNPLWTDSGLNDALRTGMIRLSSRFPAEASTTITVLAGVRTVAVTPAMDRDRILRVLDERGEPVREALEAGTDAVLTWRWWNGALQLSREPGADAEWSMEYRETRTMPADDVTAVDLPFDDEPILIAFALETILRTRAVEEMKRNGNSRAPLMLADAAMAEAEHLIRNRRKSVRSRLLVTS
jgi:hypothetical protein